jgi:hypothetical protein
MMLVQVCLDETTHLDHPIWGVTNYLGSEYTMDAANKGDAMAKEKVGERVAYRIRVQGKLDDCWSEWFSGLTITVESESPPVTELIGVIDQPALRGILNKIWDLNLALVSVMPIEADKASSEEVGNDD